MQVTPYLFFNGNCKDAIEFYRKVLSGTIEAMMTHAGTPAERHVGPEWSDKILHACLNVQGQRLMASDVPATSTEKPQGFSVSLTIDTVEQAERIYDDLSAGGKISMPIGETFWAQRFGMFVDRFGTPWMVNCPPTALNPLDSVAAER